MPFWVGYPTLSPWRISQLRTSAAQGLPACVEVPDAHSALAPSFDVRDQVQ